MLTASQNGTRASCGYWGNIGKIAAQQCRCSFRQIENYRQRISGPLLDRIDHHVEIPPVRFRELSSDDGGGESSAAIRGRVVAAREIQAARFRKSANATNSAMGPPQVKTHCKLDSESMGYPGNSVNGANIAGFIRVEQAMVALGLI